MNVLSKAVCAAMLIAVTVIVTGCGETFRQVATPEPVPAGNPSGTETEVVLNQCPSGILCTDESGTPTGSVITAINVSGDTNAGNQPVQNNVASVVGPVQVGVAFSMASPIAFDSARTSVFTANTSTPANVSTDSVTKLSLAASTAGFAANTTTLTLPGGSLPTGISFQYFGTAYTQEYVVDQGSDSADWLLTCPNPQFGGGLTVIEQATPTVRSTVCLPPTSRPVAAWIYKDLSKVFVLDFNLDQVYVVNASTLKVTNTIPVGSGPFKVSQSNDGLFIYVLNADGTISIIDGQAEAVVGLPVVTNVLTGSVPIDMTQDTNFNDTSANTQINHIWVLHADGTVSVFDGSNVAVSNTLRLVTSLTITAVQATAGAFPTNIALLRDGTQAYVGIGNTDKIVAIDTLSGAMTPITVGGERGHRTIQETLTNNITPGSSILANVLVEVTTPTVTSVAVSRQGNSSQLSKAYATIQTTTRYFCYDENVNPTDCANSNPWANGTPITALPPATPFLVAGCTNLGVVVDPLDASKNLNAMSCPNLYNGTTIVAAADISSGARGSNHAINTVITTLPAPLAVANCDAGNPETGAYDLQKNCPDMLPVLALGRN